MPSNDGAVTPEGVAWRGVAWRCCYNCRTRERDLGRWTGVLRLSMSSLFIALAASCFPVAQPPEATNGIPASFNFTPALASSTQFPTSSSPGCPPQSNPSMEIYVKCKVLLQICTGIMQT